MMYFGGFGWLFMAAFWALVIGTVVLVVKGFTEKDGYRNNKDSSALDILKKRYAKGEISKKEFETMKKDLINS